jgi:adenine phosphoribosyltransferase
MDLKTLVRDIPDFPVPGILFRDITPLLQQPEAFNQALAALEPYVASREPEAIVAIESRGFILGAPLASRLSLPFVPVRKPGKLPSERMSIEYGLEYGAGQLDIHADALKPGQRVVIIDDLIATGGTAAATAKLVKMLDARVAGFAFLIELADLGGRARLEGEDVFSLLRYD